MSYSQKDEGFSAFHVILIHTYIHTYIYIYNLVVKVIECMGESLGFESDKHLMLWGAFSLPIQQGG